ncbi:hypothetical protein ARHIZOSPH14_04700 [Agromyces rhizosphaerae]|uniref:AB hydrolase-1 domain-containing protein n=1 Tax=Agromyces rhizosphaerae TaxID=88374 RepID=A0A9W6CYK7_9MICO|nr:alpha/beta hydrolase [Agromyces rhizosphaerae]GLI26228.1 hypothetical protein ARHIZOSPH14_04700 [Agromyces rhizosphaerae]
MHARTPKRREVRARDGARIACAVLDGTGPPIVLLHGLAGSGREFLPTARAFPERRVVLVDQRGHGASTTLPADVSREAFVDDVVRVIDAVGNSPVDLVGQSMGAHTAMLVAAARPDLVRHLVLLEGNEGGGTAEEHEALGDFLRSWPVPFAGREQAAKALGGGPLARAWAADLAATADGFVPRFDADVMVRAITAVATPRWDEWERVTAPTLVVYGRDGMFTEHQRASFAARGRDVARVDLSTGSHDAHLDAFDEWIRALAGFLA